MRTIIFFIVCCAVAAVVPLFARQTANPIESISFPGWPAQFEGHALTELPLSTREKHFAEGFPGRIARFSDGQREIIFRWVTHETRALHPAADCFRGLGYSVHQLPLTTDSEGNRWGTFEASRDKEALILRERIYSVSGQSWTDVSSWYWQVLLGNADGGHRGWWVVTVAERR